MKCQNCGTLNNVGYKFCVKCGQSLMNLQNSVEQPLEQIGTLSQEVTISNINNTLVQNENNFQKNSTFVHSTMNTLTGGDGSVVKMSFMEYLFIMLAVILKPFTAFKEELNKFNEFKNSVIMSLIVSGLAAIATLITSMLNIVRVKSYDWLSGGYKVTWNWEKIKELDYLEVIVKNFLIYLGVIIAITCVYYVVNLIVKKQVKFARLLGISALAVTPLLICSLVISPLLSLIWSDLAVPIIIVGVVYTIVLLYEVINSELLLEGNVKYYFNLVCFSILGIAAYYLYMKMFMSSVSDGFENIMDLFR